ncbi:hypothetical protein ACFLT9_02020 [Acidobacteriota bacterium]
MTETKQISRTFFRVALFLIFAIFVLASTSCKKETAVPEDTLFPNLIREIGLSCGSNGQCLFDGIIPAEEVSIDASLSQPSRAHIRFDLQNIQPDKYYLFQSEFKRDQNIVGIYPYLLAFGQEVHFNDFWRQGEWQPLSYILKGPNPEEKMDYFLIRAAEGRYMLSVRNSSLREISASLSVPEEDSQLKSKTIQFGWRLPETDRLLNVNILISKDRSFNGTDRITLKTDNRSHELEIPNNLDTGEWFWKIEVFLYRELIAESDVRNFSILSSHKDSRTDKSSPEKHDPVYNPSFFPIGTYGVGEKDFEELGRLGFNAVVTGARDTEHLIQIVKRAQENGIRPLLSVPSDMMGKKPPNALRPKEAEILFSEAVLGWYLDDEPEGRSISPKIIRDKYDRLRELGFRQPGAIALSRPWRALDYAPAVDVFMSDQYPVPFNPLSWLSESLDLVDKTIAGDRTKRSWAIPQAFDWGTSSAQAKATGIARPPTTAEVKALTYLAIIHRATGIFYFTYGSGGLKKLEDTWSGVKETVQELDKIYPFLIAPDSDIKIKVECPDSDEWGYPAVHVLLKKKPRPDGGPHYLMAVNTLDRAVTAEIILIEDKDYTFVEGFDILSDQPIPIPNGTLKLHFSPLERKIIRIIVRGK